MTSTDSKEETLLKSLRESQKKYDFDTKERTIEIINAKFCNQTKVGDDGQEYEIEGTSEIYIPPYQRSYKRNITKQCEFIESLLLEMPIPYIYVADVEEDNNPDFVDEGRLEIVDGSQRIRTIHKFLNDEFTLKDLKKLPDFNGNKFSDFPDSIKRKFLRTSIKWIELRGIALEDRKDFFRRINSNNVSLEEAEKRKGEFDDTRFYDMLKEIIASDIFKELMVFSEKKQDREEAFEYLTRFFCYYDKFGEYNGKVKDFLYSYVEEKQDLDDNEINEKKELINKVLLFVKDNLANGFVKPQKDKETQIINWGNSNALNSRVYFEALSVGIAFALRENEKLEIDKEKFNNFLLSDNFYQLVSSDGANSHGKFNDRILSVKNALLENTL